jgi:Spy/CpxP family protein refolding chaperone
MKTYFLPLCLVGVCLVAAPSLRADDTSTIDQSAPATASGSTATAPSTGQQGERMGRFKAALAQLDLTDAQKAQIKQIYTTVTDRKERRQQIVAVLTPDQKAKLRQLIQEHREQMQANGGTAAAPAAN